MKPLKTWALIADGARARILENIETSRADPQHGATEHREARHEWIAVEGLVFHGDHSSTHDLMTDRQGRSFGPAGAGRSALEARTDPHQHQKTKFVKQLADMLAERLQAGAYHRLVIAASPNALGELRGMISDKVRASIVAEFPHDLTKVPNHEIASHLKPIPL